MTLHNAEAGDGFDADGLYRSEVAEVAEHGLRRIADRPGIGTIAATRGHDAADLVSHLDVRDHLIDQGWISTPDRGRTCTITAAGTAHLHRLDRHDTTEAASSPGTIAVAKTVRPLVPVTVTDLLLLIAGRVFERIQAEPGVTLARACHRQLTPGITREHVLTHLTALQLVHSPDGARCWPVHGTRTTSTGYHLVGITGGGG